MSDAVKIAEWLERVAASHGELVPSEMRDVASTIRELVAALEPFATASAGLGPRDYDAKIVAWIGDAEPNGGGAYGIHASDFRRARKALGDTQ